MASYAFCPSLSQTLILARSRPTAPFPRPPSASLAPRRRLNMPVSPTSPPVARRPHSTSASVPPLDAGGTPPPLDAGGTPPPPPSYNPPSGPGDDSFPSGPPFRPWLWPLAALQWYLAALESWPLRVKAATSCLLGAASDLLAQAIEGRPIAWRRVAALAAVGLVLTAPLFHFLYLFLERVAPVAGAARLRNLALQLFVDQGLAGPLWLVAFFGVVETVEGGGVDLASIRRSLRRDFLTSLKLTWAVFPALQLVSFAYLPSSMRVLWMNLIDFVYTAALSYIKHA